MSALHTEGFALISWPNFLLRRQLEVSSRPRTLRYEVSRGAHTKGRIVSRGNRFSSSFDSGFLGNLIEINKPRSDLVHVCRDPSGPNLLRCFSAFFWIQQRSLALSITFPQIYSKSRNSNSYTANCKQQNQQ